MVQLIKADLFKALKSKLSLINLIIAVSMPLFMVLLYYFFGKLLGDDFGIAFNARSLIYSCFSISNNIGLAVPVFSAILVSLDLNNGSLRNKVIAGKKRTDIYLSHLIVSIIYNVTFMLLYFVVTTLFSLIFLDYGVKFAGEEVKSFFYMALTGLLTFAFLATITTFFALSMNSIAPAIIFTLVTNVLLMSIGAGISFVLDPEKFYRFFIYAFPTFTNTVSSMMSLDSEAFFVGISSYALFGGANIVLGLLVFNKKDLK